MENAIKLAAQVMFVVFALFFTVYGVMAMYALKTYGQSKKVASGLNLTFGVVMLGLISWGVWVVMGIQ